MAPVSVVAGAFARKRAPTRAATRGVLARSLQRLARFTPKPQESFAMKTVFSITCLICLLGSWLHVATAADTATIKLRHDGEVETIQVPLAELKAGESRQLATGSGRPAIVTRTEQGLTIESGGRVTELPLPGLSGDPRADGKRIVSVHSEGERRVQIRRSEHDSFDQAELDALLGDLDGELGDGDRHVIIMRHDASDRAD
jgi:hypothetical protein